MTVQEVIDALVALGPEACDLPVIIKGGDVFLDETEAVVLMSESNEVIIMSTGL